MSSWGGLGSFQEATGSTQEKPELPRRHHRKHPESSRRSTERAQRAPSGRPGGPGKHPREQILREGGQGESHSLHGLCTGIAYRAVTASMQDCWALIPDRQSPSSQDFYFLGIMRLLGLLNFLLQGWCLMLENPQQRIEPAALQTKPCSFYPSMDTH